MDPVVGPGMAGLPRSDSGCSSCWSRSPSTSSASPSSNTTKEMKTMTRIRNHPMAALGVLVLGLFMTLLDLTIVNIAIPSILDGLHASLDQVLWVLNAYSLLYAVLLIKAGVQPDRKSTRLNSSHSQISYAVFCLKKKKYYTNQTRTHPSMMQH